MKTPERVNLQVKVSRWHREELVRIAAEQGRNISSLMESMIDREREQWAQARKERKVETNYKYAEVVGAALIDKMNRYALASQHYKTNPAEAIRDTVRYFDLRWIADSDENGTTAIYATDDGRIVNVWYEGTMGQALEEGGAGFDDQTEWYTGDPVQEKADADRDAVEADEVERWIEEARKRDA